LIPPPNPNGRGRHKLFCDAACADLFKRRLAHLRHTAASLASTRQRLACLDLRAVALLSSGTSSTADLVEVALQSANVASGRTQIYLGVLARLHPASSRYDRGGRPRKVETRPSPRRLLQSKQDENGARGSLG
jgi:hypothetical protein